ncbi:MAG TPA: aldehyde dehydrogenase family protein, partial [Kofleriaceae bacterium]|nr:aldehyde dehydrogenase family protein [Kofleriaceae bacterium]
MIGNGDYIRGAFLPAEGEPLVSRNPARGGETVFETAWSAAQVARATAAAAEAALPWSRLSIDDRYQRLLRFKAAIAERKSELAEAIMLETGKLASEASAEVGALLARFELIRALVDEDLHPGALPGMPAEQLRYHALGVVAVIGPFNYPAHLCHAHVVPALLLGNAVVVKPSEVTPLVGQRYAEAAHAAGLPPGVFNLVQGRGATGATLVADPAVRGVCFTGSYDVGRRIQVASLDRPELLVALEMGGKNTVVVLDDADLRQAAHEIVVGGYLTTGQRCTATDRVLVQRRVAAGLLAALRPLVSSLRFGDPTDPASFAGPLATTGGLERFRAAVAAGTAAGAELIAEGQPVDGPFYARAVLHALTEGVHHVPGYTDTELFGPDVHVEIVEDDAEAISVIDASPYGFANAVFTGSPDRFERIYAETKSGILNRNRSTNLASPRLPFGGVGKSGNYRPAGSHSPRNVVVPIAVQENVLGTVQVHPMLADALPDPDLAALDARHAAEDAVEARRSLLETPRPMVMRFPRGGRLPESDEWLTRLYAGDRVVREKKPAVFDHLRSAGPWFVSIDEQPLSVLDGMSQTATLCGGFSEDHVVRAYFEGAFGDTLMASTDTSARDTEPARAYANTLRHLVPGLPHVSFTNSGAEANEKALALCKQAARPGASRVLAFEGSFHGRTLWALHHTYNPSKREPFQIAGHETTFAPFPVWSTPNAEEPSAPSGFYAQAGLGEIAELVARFGATSEDPLLAAEVASLAAVHHALASGDYFVCVIEPMQSEGGDRYATARFFRALRLLTRHHGVCLVFDEVQSGFGLGGSFAWHTSFRLVNFRGQPDYPDAVAFAKRAQVGVVMSRFEDPEPSSSHGASLVRGRLHAEMMTTTHDAERVEKLVWPALKKLQAAFPHLVGDPRCKGYAFAFDLPTTAQLDAYLGQRFWRGAIVFGAGSRTVRYRLSDGFHGRDVQMLLATVRQSLSWLDAHPAGTPPAWEDAPAAPASKPVRNDVVLSTVDTETALSMLPQILDIEYMVYEPARRTPPGQIREAIEAPDSVVTFAEVPDGDDWQLVGFAISAPLEICTGEEGPDRDPMLGRDNSLYSVSVTVADEYQGLGIGRALKLEQLREAAKRRTPDGRPRFRYVSSRNRVGVTASMRHLNRVFGAHTVSVLTGQYEDPEGQALYSRTPLPPYAPYAPEGVSEPSIDASADVSDGIARPFAEPPASLRVACREGLLYGPAINKVTIMNYATPAMVRALEWIGALIPELPHLYLTSSRDECIDKGLRILRWHRKDAQIAIGFEGGYLGHTTGATRSISDPAVHRQGEGPFAWPRVPHPAAAGVDASIAALRAILEDRGGAHVLGLFYELVQERTGRVMPAA